MANNTTLRDGNGALFSAESIDVGSGLQRASTAANIRVGNTDVAVTNPVPTSSIVAGNAVAAANPLPVTESLGAAITGATIPAGGVGMTGWLSAIWSKIGSTVTTALGTAQRVTLVDPATGNGSLVQAFHNSDNQAIGATSYGLMTGGVDQLLNSAGNLDRKRGVAGDAMPVTGLAAEVPMVFNGSTYDRLYGDKTNGAWVNVKNASLPLPAGAATDSSLQSILSAIKATVDISGSVWYDPTVSPYVYYVRRETVNEGTGSVTVAWYTPGGASATPTVANLVAVSNTQNIAQDVTVFTATSSGTGYASGDILIHAFGINTALPSPTVSYSFWLNAGPSTTGIMSAAPSAGTYATATQAVSASTLPLPAGAATAASQPALNADGGSLAHVTNFPATQAVSLSSLPSLAAGTNTVGNALNLVTGSATWNITPSTTSYQPGYSLGGVQSFTVPPQGQIKNARLSMSSGSYSGAIDLLLFSAAPSAYADNTAVTISTADQVKLLGVLHMSDSTALGGAAFLAQALNQSFGYNIGGTTIYALMIVRGSAFTFAASSTATLNFAVLQ